MKITELVPFSEFTSIRALRKLQTAHLARLDHEGGSFKRNSDHNSLSRTFPMLSSVRASVYKSDRLSEQTYSS
jgi:hypothetical protein